jgi:ABC-type uncharacterized transport system auxiliary subunit
MTIAIQFRPTVWRCSVVMLTALLLCAACAQEKSADPSTREGSSTSVTPSAIDHTYHGELMKARSRAIRTLQGVDAQRKELQQEERSFDRSAEPTPSRENP